MAQITTQEKALLTLCAKGESEGTGGDPYCAVYSGENDPRITEFTISQLYEFQRSRMAAGYGSDACGRYQFREASLREAVKFAGLDSNTTKFSRDVQDILILAYIKKYKKLEEWKSGAITDAEFCIKLAQVFASVPVPYDMIGHNGKPRKKGESYYDNGIDQSHHNADTFLANLADIRNGGAGTITEVDIQQGNIANQPTGTSQRMQTEIAANGGQRIFGGNAADRPLVSSRLPAPSNVYVYEKTDPYDNRYDFRTGRKVRDMLINGINPTSNQTLISGNGLPSPNDIGGRGYSDSEIDAALNGRSSTDGKTVTKVNQVDGPAGVKTITSKYQTIMTPKGPVEVLTSSQITTRTSTGTTTGPNVVYRPPVTPKPLPPSNTQR
jgi:muramidase (phage lysozyme)